MFDIYLPLVRHEQQPGFGLAVRKEILRRRGAIRSAAVRAPGPSSTPTISRSSTGCWPASNTRLSGTRMSAGWPSR